jgi:hypothetical protein
MRRQNSTPGAPKLLATGAFAARLPQKPRENVPRRASAERLECALLLRDPRVQVINNGPLTLLLLINHVSAA